MEDSTIAVITILGVLCVLVGTGIYCVYTKTKKFETYIEKL